MTSLDFTKSERSLSRNRVSDADMFAGNARIYERLQSRGRGGRVAWIAFPIAAVAIGAIVVATSPRHDDVATVDPVQTSGPAKPAATPVYKSVPTTETAFGAAAPADRTVTGPTGSFSVHAQPPVTAPTTSHLKGAGKPPVQAKAHVASKPAAEPMVRSSAASAPETIAAPPITAAPDATATPPAATIPAPATVNPPVSEAPTTAPSAPPADAPQTTAPAAQ